MIPAKPARWANIVFSKYLKRLMKRSFNSVQLLGDVPDLVPDLPVLLLPNHSTWWDGFFAYWLNKQLFQRPFYLLMLERELKKYPFFRKVGAFGITQENPKSVIKTIAYTRSLLAMDSHPLITIFPQGELLPNMRRPLGYKNGVERILQKYDGRVNVLPLAIRCEFLGKQMPDAHLLFGKNHVFCRDSFPGMQWLEEIEEHVLQDLSQQIDTGEIGCNLLTAIPERSKDISITGNFSRDIELLNKPVNLLK